MPKKIEEAEVKKECPSCGLGVALDSTICEFCGWDFEEEDEWILQIEKLERDLMLEKQKFEPGTVNEKIESTLHSPVVVMQEVSKSSPKPAAVAPPRTPAPAPKRAPAAEAEKPARPSEPDIQRPAQSKPEPSRPVAAKAPAPAPEEAPSAKVRRVRIVKSASAQEEGEEVTPSKRRLVRKVKERS